MAKGNVGVDLLRLVRGGTDDEGLNIVTVDVGEPRPKFKFEGTPKQLDSEIFEIPVSVRPLCQGDRLLAYKVGPAQRWGLLVKLNQGVTLATVQGDGSLSVPGMASNIPAGLVIKPAYFVKSRNHSTYTDDTGITSADYLHASSIQPLAAGDVVSIAATMQNNTLKYAILERY